MTTNEIMFDCQVDIYKNEPLAGTLTKILDYLHDYNLHSGKEVNNNFSHDNWKGIVCWMEKFNSQDLDMVPLWGMHSLRPDNFAFFLYAKYRRVGSLFIWIWVLFQVFDAIRMRKDKEGIPHTSGLLLNYMIFACFDFPLTEAFVTRRVKDTFGSWDEVFARYHRKDHRVRLAYERR